jgi:hypothetical protein
VKPIDRASNNPPPAGDRPPRSAARGIVLCIPVAALIWAIAAVML